MDRTRVFPCTIHRFVGAQGPFDTPIQWTCDSAAIPRFATDTARLGLSAMVISAK